MKPRILMPAITLTLFLLTACSGATAAPTSVITPSPEPTPTPTFAPSRLGSTEYDVTYCTMDDLPQQMDVYYPDSGGPWPVLVYVHGGSWVEGDKADGEGWGDMAGQGYLVVSLNYRLATVQIKFPDMIEDVKCAVRYLRAHASQYNIDPEHIGAIGASAGGHLVALLGTADQSAGWDGGEYADQSSRVQAVIVMSGPADFTLSFPDGLTMPIYFAFDGLPGTDAPVMVAASPVTYATADDPPFLILHGDQDGVVPVEQGQALHARLEEAGAPSTLMIVQGGDHGLQGSGGQATIPSQQEINEAIADFLESNLK